MIGRVATLALVWTLDLSRGFAAQPAPVAAIDVSRDLGLFAANSQSNFRLLIKHGELKPGREITLIWVPVEGEPHKPEIRRGKIIAKLAAPCDDTNAQADDCSYRLEAGKFDNERIYIAVAAQPNDLRIAGGGAERALRQSGIDFPIMHQHGRVTLQYLVGNSAQRKNYLAALFLSWL